MTATAWAFPDGKTGRPYMQSSDIIALTNVLHKLKPEKVLEYGAGGSSVYFPSICPFVKVWLSIEHEPVWAVEVMAQAPKDSPLVVYAVYDGKNYVTAPEKYGKFNLIIIDGIQRDECLEHSHKLLAPGGMVILHDAGRKQHRHANKVYPHWKRLTEGNTPDGFGYYKRDGILLMWGD